MIRFRHFVYVVSVVFLGCTTKRSDDHPRVLISADWLDEHFDDPSLVILHVGTADLFDSIHIPGARFIDPYDFTRDTEVVRNEVQSLEIIDSLLSGVGVNAGSRIILYHENEKLLLRTARVFVTLDYVGLGNRTHLLNGGLPGWIEQDRETTNQTQAVTPGQPGIKMNPGVILHASDLNEYRMLTEYVILDVRSMDEYRGEIDTAELKVSGGHIEGARFHPYQNVLSSDNPHMFLDDEALKKSFEELGMTGKKISVHYCNSGMRASVSYLAARHMGYPALLYDGSFEEWEKLDFPVVKPVYLADDN